MSDNVEADLVDDKTVNIEDRVDGLATFVHAFANSLPEPIFDQENRCFRYRDPDFKHFCLLRSSRVVSAFYAALVLAKAGHVQEICVLMRTVLEFCSQIDFVILSLYQVKRPTGRAADFVEDYFKDDYDSRSSEAKRLKLRQQDVHKSLGAHLDEFMDKPAPTTARMMSGSYVNFSNYVHARHVESMDLYGGTPGRFHLFGMAGTPKDDEIAQILETMVVTAEFSFVGQHHALLIPAMLADRDVKRWYSKVMADAVERNGVA